MNNKLGGISAAKQEVNKGERLNLSDEATLHHIFFVVFSELLQPCDVLLDSICEHAHFLLSCEFNDIVFLDSLLLYHLLYFDKQALLERKFEFLLLVNSKCQSLDIAIYQELVETVNDLAGINFLLA